MAFINPISLRRSITVRLAILEMLSAAASSANNASIPSRNVSLLSTFPCVSATCRICREAVPGKTSPI